MSTIHPDSLALPPARRRWGCILLFLLLSLAELGLCAYAARQQRFYVTTGLRFAAPLSEEQLLSVKEYQCKTESGQGIYASFWGQTKKNISADNGFSVQDVICIGYCGNAWDCLPAEYLAGGPPGSEGNECSVSAALANALFGSDQVVGLSVRVDHQSFRIVGVFASPDAVLLFPTVQNLQCAELTGVSLDVPKADALNWCTSAGLPVPQIIVYGPQRIGIAHLLCGIPLFLTGVYMLVILLRLSFSWSVLARNGLWFVLALGFALSLPALLAHLPGWLIPARWSDLSFWETLAAEIRQNRLVWKSVPHYWRDLERFR